MKKAYFIDLDNTIYFTKPNVEVLLGPLYCLLENEDLGISEVDFEKAKEEMLRTPFQKVATRYHFKEEVVAKAIDFLKERTLTIAMDVHDEYHYIKSLEGLKVIVTAGFTKTQTTKVQVLGIAHDFDELFVVDNTLTDGNKKDAFLILMKKYGLQPDDVLVVGDDPESEIKYGLDLGMTTFLYDPNGNFPNAETSYYGTTFKNISLIS